MSMTRVIAAVAGLVMLASIASAQAALGDVAKKEETRRKDVKTPAKVPPSPSGVQPKDGDKAATDEPKKDEAYWKGRIAKARADLDRNQTFADALQSRINALTTDFAARSDPAQRAQIGNDRNKALAELDRLKKEITANTKAIADIQDEARKAGIPAGWVR